MTGQTIVALALAVLGPGGIVAAWVALQKLRPEQRTAFIVQAQGAVVAQDTLLKGVERERDYWRREAERLRRENEHLREELERFEVRVGELMAEAEKLRADLVAMRERLS